MTKSLSPIVTIEELEAFAETEFPQVHQDGRVFKITELGDGTLTMRFDPGERHLRPGGTVSGPSLFTLADVTAYFAILSHIGLKALSVTTNMNINFMRRPKPGPLFCTCRILKLGQRLAVADASIADQDGELVAHATCTYSIPPRE